MSTTVVEDYRALRKAGKLPEALTLARRMVPEASGTVVSQLGKLLQKDLASGDGKTLKVLLLGQCTTNYLPSALTAWAWSNGLQLRLTEGQYDQMMQELMQLPEADAPDVVILLPWHQRLLAHDSRRAQERLEDEMMFWQAAWSQVARLRSKLIQVGYDWVNPCALGFSLSSRQDGDIALVQQANASLKAALPKGTYWVDLESISAWHGKRNVYDERNYHWLKQPFSSEGLSAVARHMATGLRVLTGGRRKVLVLDLDNTVWGGVVGEVGWNGIALGGSAEGEAFIAFQKLVKKLKASGILLGVCSKNNEADAREPFEKNEALLLKLADFATFHASWDPKPLRIRQMAKELNLGLDSFVFFDDNPAEREHVRAELPEVTVVEVPVDPALYVRALKDSLAFETTDISQADAERADQYHAENARKELAASVGSAGDYLASLQMRAAFEAVSESNLDRVTDLITKTNQFNLTTRRHSRATVEGMAALPDSICFAVKMQDRFGDYGLVAVVLAIPDSVEQGTLRIDSWLMSCRAMGRSLEHLVMNYLARNAREKGYQSLLGEYLPTAKNEPVKNLLRDFGFVSGSVQDRQIVKLDQFFDLPTQVSEL